ncbi:MAG: hypothetical protein HYZ71_14495 [Deltaproteobacteria bacterium]|nr:hypothetical protein [Deltaproteobacteria bacterium]
MRWGLLLTLAAPVWAASCPPITWDDLKDRLTGKDAHLIFFASWCMNCQDHLAKYPKNAVFIATFDEQRRAEQIIAHFRVKAPCYTDIDVARHFGIRAVPADRDFRGTGAKKIEPVALTFP